MARTSEIIAGLTVAGFVAVAAGLALTPGAADAGYGVAAKPPAASNSAAKSDRLASKPLPAGHKALEVAEIRKVGDNFVLIDSKGREVYRSDRSTRTTTVAKDADLPLITGYGVAAGPSRVDTAFQKVRD